MKRESLETLSDDDIIARRAEVMRDLMATQLQLRIGQLEDTSKVKKIRRNVARLNTELRTRELASGLSKGALLGRGVARLQEEGVEGTGTETTAKRSRFGFGFIRDALLGKRSE